MPAARLPRDKAALVGRRVLTALTAHIDDGACGWFINTLTASGVGKGTKKQAPTAMHVVYYKSKETGSKDLQAWQGGQRALYQQLCMVARSGSCCCSQSMTR